MAEEQALDRVHRMGQLQEVVATRYVVKNSIEEVSSRLLGVWPKLICMYQYVIEVQKLKTAVIDQSFEEEGSIDMMSLKERFLKVRTLRIVCLVSSFHCAK